MEHGRAQRTYRIAVVVLNYRTPDLVRDCLETLVPEVDPMQDCILLVDNASGDDSVAKLRQLVLERNWRALVQLIESPHNGGFAAGNNVGIRTVSARAYLLLNSDTLVRQGAVARLWQELQSDLRLGLVGPRLEWPDGEPQISCFRDLTPWSALISGSQTGVIRKLLDAWDVPLPVSDQPLEPEWLSFAAILIRREVIEQVGLLDERFFLYFEDADYCRMARNAGWHLRYCPDAHVVHLRGGTSPVKALQAQRKRRPRYYYQARSHYLAKHYGWVGLLAANALWSMGRAIAWLRELVGNKAPHTVENELLDTWRG